MSMAHASRDLITFKQGLTNLLGPGNISASPAVLQSYAEDEDMKNGHRPYLAVYPENKEHVQAIVRMAGACRMPLIPVSSGTPRFHGDTVPEENGVMVDFSRMNTIWEINPTGRFARIGPGVTYGRLIPALAGQGLKLSLPLLPRSNKSVLTSCLEREARIIPKYQYDYVDPLLTLEVVYGNGDDFRTGSASGPGTLETLKADKVNPWGPGSVDYFRLVSGAQGTMGLITWAVVKTEIMPTLQQYYYVTADAVDTLMPVVNRLLKKRVGDECLILNHVNLAAILAESGPGDYQSLKRTLPPWTLIVALAGYHRRPDERLGIQTKYLKEICRQQQMTPLKELPGAGNAGQQLPELLAQPWQQESHWTLPAQGARRTVFFLSAPSQAPRLAALVRSTAVAADYPVDEIGGYLQPLVQGRGCHCEFILPYDPNDSRQVHRMDSLEAELHRTLMARGAFFSRPYGTLAQRVYREDSPEVQALKKVKAIFDPQRIFNPGKLCF
jgi:FAD/FMN-containing dehydrogenase